MIQIDFETLATTPDAMLVSLALVRFPDVGDQNSWKLLNEAGAFECLVRDNSINIKFELKSQRGLRVMDSRTIAWWKNQGEAAKQIKPSDEDLTLAQALPIIVKFFKDHFDPQTDLLYSRGNAFDISMFEHYLVQQDYLPYDLFRFWNVRCVRTDIGSTLMNRSLDKCHIRKEDLKGFVAHNPVHDCCKDIMMMYYAQQYSLGNMEYPEAEDSHEVTINYRK
jgi:hypothetical protein